MKELPAGRKAKPVQLAGFKCFVCPLDVPGETLPSGDDECAEGSAAAQSLRRLVPARHRAGAR